MRPAKDDYKTLFVMPEAAKTQFRKKVFLLSKNGRFFLDQFLNHFTAIFDQILGASVMVGDCGVLNANS